MSGDPPPRLPSWRGRDARGRSLTLRAASGRDAARYLAHLRRLVSETPYMLQGPQDPLPSTSHQQGWLDDLYRRGRGLCLVALQPDEKRWFFREQVVGSLTLVCGRTRRTEHHAQLGMGVERTHWRLGIGGRLLDLCVEWARAHPTIGRVSLQVYGSNAAALGLYASRGFEREGVLRCEARSGSGWEDLEGMALDVR